nr:MAG TPA: hypothetical protein [Caudoviricetes sp.]
MLDDLHKTYYCSLYRGQLNKLTGEVLHKLNAQVAFLRTIKSI